MTFSPEQLKQLNHGRPPLRRVRKKLFVLRLWQPARQRHQQRTGLVSRSCASATSAPDVNKARRLPADPSMIVGWLNISLSNKNDAVERLIVERSFDVMALTETRHSASDDARLRLAVPAGYAVVDAARQTRRGGGVAIVSRKTLKCAQISLPTCESFEAVCVRLTAANGPVIPLNVYRPGSG